jgi:hypothetical protein
VIVEDPNRGKSDHTPLLLNIGSKSQQDTHQQFKFELGWLIRDDFFDMVTTIWQQATGDRTAIEISQNKI